jgi:two-component system phosphate regulon sensor histidine kinase PhoR
LTSIVWFILGVACTLGGVWFWRRSTRRMLRELSATAAAFARGNWKHRVPSVEPGELPVSRDVARLAERLAGTADRTLREIKDLARQRSDLHALVDAMPDPILLADTRRKVILLNAPAAGLLEIDRAAALGNSVEAAVSEPAVLALFDQTAAIELGEKDEQGEPRLPLRRSLRLSRGGKPLAFQAVATRSAAGGVLVVLRDISTLDAALRMKSDFVANAGHELRTPVSALKAAFETLVDLAEEGPAAMVEHGDAVGRCMNILGGHLLRLEEMLRDLLDLSRVESGEQRPIWEEVTTTQLAGELRQMLAPLAAEKGVDLSLPSGEGRIVTDRRLLMLALKNLVENGIKYTPAGGSVSLDLALRDLTGDAGAFHRQLTGDTYREAVLTVSDSGIGIKPENLDRVFERFFQVDSARSGTNPRTSGRGTGLGLSIVKHAVGALGGGINVESRPGVGSTFTIVLPQVRTPDRVNPRGLTSDSTP